VTKVLPVARSRKSITIEEKLDLRSMNVEHIADIANAMRDLKSTLRTIRK
jgi:hypothetical protein